jgi:hypothetical protein
MGPLEALRENNWFFVNVWIVVGTLVLAVLIVIGNWLLTGWITNVLRNYLDAKRRLRRREPD